MVPTNFEESNQVLSRPIDLTDEQCNPLCVLQTQLTDGSNCVISCWKLTVDELKLINETGRVWLVVLGRSMHPVALSVEKPFKERK